MLAIRRRGFLLTALGALAFPGTEMTLSPSRQFLRSTLWKWPRGAGLERFELLRDQEDWVLRGTILTWGKQEPAEARYQVLCDPDWRTKHVEVVLQEAGAKRSLKLNVQAGRWYENGQERQAVHGCIDVDLGWSPSTNTLPIRRLRLDVGKSSGPLTVAWVHFPEVTLEPLKQEYVRLAERRYLYKRRDATFKAELEVDDDGLVVKYEGLWERVRQAR